jgi:hypothetical protein
MILRKMPWVEGIKNKGRIRMRRKSKSRYCLYSPGVFRLSILCGTRSGLCAVPTQLAGRGEVRRGKRCLGAQDETVIFGRRSPMMAQCIDSVVPPCWRSLWNTASRS